MLVLKSELFWVLLLEDSLVAGEAAMSELLSVWLVVLP
jgi:hypothetical protein